MKVCLIYPNLEGTPQSLDMGVAYLATYIDQRTHHKVRIIDPTFNRKNWRSYIKTELDKFDPDVVGISVVSLYFNYAREISKMVKEQKDIPIIAGGYQPMMAPEETITASEFDAICTGDGEYTMEEYLNALESGTDLGGVKGIWFKQDGRVIKNEKREYIKDLDALPTPDYDLFDDIDKYLYHLQRMYVIGTRGCPYNCSFCAESILHQMNPGKRFRERDPRKYVREIEYLYKKYKDRGFKAAHIYDAVFTFNKNWLDEWAHEYKSRGLDKVLPYSTFLKADRHNASDEKLKQLAETGCLQVRIGIESGDDNIREGLINKKGSGDNVAMDIIDKCNKYGFIVKTYSIFGIPGDTKESIQKTYNYSNTPLIHIPFCFSYTPLPNTPLAERVKAADKSRKPEEIYSFHFSSGAKNEGLPPFYVTRMVLKAYMHFGLKIAWKIWLANPITFLPYMVSRVYRAFRYRCSILLALVYALINPLFWPNLSKRIKKKWHERHPF